MIDIQTLIQVISDNLFGGDTTIGGILIMVMVMLVIVAIVRNVFATLVISLPVAFVFSTLKIIPQDLMILIIVVAVLGLAYTSRGIWRD